MVKIQHPEENYRIVKRLGTAQKRKFSEVYLVQSKKNPSAEFILKYAYSALGTEQLRNESAYHFEHPSLPKVIDFKSEESSAYLVLNYKKGITLKEYFDSVPKKTSFETCVEILTQLLPVFDQLQQLHIAHLDIKPNNILICPETHAVHLIDFGMATSFYSTKQRKLVFPLGYAAPELLLNRLHLVDQRTDYFALAVSIFQLFEGKLPLLHANPGITTNLQLTHPLMDCSQLDKVANKSLQKLGAKHPFKTAPNKLSPEQLDQFLIEGMNSRYERLQDFIEDFKLGKRKKSWFGF